MRYSSITYFDTANARGLSTVLWVQGCTHNCPNCHNPQTHNFCDGYEMSREKENEIISSLKNLNISNFILSGGDPFHPNNSDCCEQIVKRIREEIKKPILIIGYTGYEITVLKDKNNGLAAQCDIIIDGRFDKNKKIQGFDYRGSYNQRALKIEKINNKNWEYVDISNFYFLTNEKGERK